MHRIIEGETAGFVAAGRLANTAAHLTHLRQEFVGQPELCFTLASCIVRIRRREQLEEHLAQFFSLLNHPQTGDFLAEQLSLRWLVSVADTLADHGTPEEATAAMIVTVLVNLVKLAETEHRLIADGTYSEENMTALLAAHPSSLFGGMICYHPLRGDMPQNMFSRIERLLTPNRFLGLAYRRVLAELRSQPNLLSRLARYNDRFFSRDAA